MAFCCAQTNSFFFQYNTNSWNISGVMVVVSLIIQADDNKYENKNILTNFKSIIISKIYFLVLK